MEEQLKKIEEYLKTKNPTLEAIILFGSYARDAGRPDSDIDIAIKCDTELKKIDLFKQGQELEELIEKDIDLVDLDNIQDRI